MLFKTTHFIAFAAIMVTTSFAVPLLGVDGNQAESQAESQGQGVQGTISDATSKVQGTVDCALSCADNAVQPLSSVECIKAGCTGQQGDVENNTSASLGSRGSTLVRYEKAPVNRSVSRT
ncbi:hypothetical protein K492DRAFT_183892 [Lichtheimia hyalospora FSU 10163]|nr:hypothetical protein K492DRAFT_183892 [Lichtheimia hyalospora FSU 10163]